jgi:hypothetical protein
VHFVIRWVAILSLVTASLVACASDPPPDVRWQKAGASEAELERAREKCLEAAAQAPVGQTRERFKVQGRANAFLRCMQADGWEQVAVE